jgi:hypothetical protein
MDYPNLRQLPNYPLCGNSKDYGCVVCGSCYRKRELPYGLRPDITKRLHTADLA